MKQVTANIRWFEKNGFEDTFSDYLKPPGNRDLQREISFFAIEDAQFLEILKTTTNRLLNRIPALYFAALGSLKNISIKIMRRLLKARETRIPKGGISTLEKESGGDK